nr:hypothetical protein [uncultured Kingella sp.]
MLNTIAAKGSLKTSEAQTNGSTRFQAAFQHSLSFARAGVSPPTTSRGKPLHPARKPFSGCLNIAPAFRQPEN